MQSANLLARVVRMPFCTDSSSDGRPSEAHCPVSTSFVRISSSLNGVVIGSSRLAISSTHREYVSLRLYSNVKAPAYDRKEEVSRQSPRSLTRFTASTRVSGPTGSLRCKTRDELLGGDETTLHQLRLVLQTFLLSGGRLELRLELRELFVERDDRLFVLASSFLRGSKRLLRLRHRRTFWVHRARDGIVVEHGKDPLEQTAARLGDAGDKLWVKVFVHVYFLISFTCLSVMASLSYSCRDLRKSDGVEHHLGVGPPISFCFLENLHALAHLLHGSGAWRTPLSR